MKKITFNALFGITTLLFSAISYAQPANDNFANAEAISCSSTYTGSTVTATLDEDSAPDGFGADMDSPNVWYTYTGSGFAETITLNLCTSAYDSSVLVYTGTSGNLTLIAGNDDDSTCGTTLTTRSRLNFESDGSTTYYIAIEGWNVASTGAFTMDVTCAGSTPPVVNNQTCITAVEIPVDGSVIDSDNSFGDVSPIQPICDAFGVIQDVWFSFVAASATVDCVVTDGTIISSNFSVYSGDCGSLTSLGCNSNITTNSTLSLTTLTAGNTYYVQVWSNAAEQGTFALSLSDPSVCLPAATFGKTSNCPADETFTVTADITSLASATSVTVTDNQGSSPQTVTSTGLVTFGPYANGLSVTLTVTNDQSPGCNLISPVESYVACPPANDECSGAYVVTVNPDASCGSVTSGTVAGASASAVDAVACFGTEDDDVWFSFVATETAHSISLSNVLGSTTDLFHSLWTGDCASLTLVPGTCTDANNSTPNGLTVGDTYYIRVNTYTATPAQTTTFDVCVGTLPPAPDNDLCDNAVALTVGNSVTAFPLVGSTLSALPTAGLTFACQNNRTNDVWYSVEAPASGLLTIETDTTAGTFMTDSVLSVFSGTCGALTEIGCDDDTGNGNFSRVVLTGLTPGNLLYIGVWRYGTSADGAFQISAYDSTLATSTFENANFRYYPNPVKDILNLSYSKNITSVTAFNLLGQEVITKPINSNLSQIDMSHLSNGTYIVKVTADNQVKTIKVVKQ